MPTPDLELVAATLAQAVLTAQSGSKQLKGLYEEGAVDHVLAIYDRCLAHLTKPAKAPRTKSADFFGDE